MKTTTHVIAVAAWLTDPRSVLEELFPVIERHIRKQDTTTGTVTINIDLIGPK